MKRSLLTILMVRVPVVAQRTVKDAGEALEDVRRIHDRCSQEHACRELQFPSAFGGDDLQPVNEAHRSSQSSGVRPCQRHDSADAPTKNRGIGQG
jgi:hypothetical protein